MTIARRYGEDPEDFRHLERVSFRIASERVFEYGQARGVPEDGRTGGG